MPCMHDTQRRKPCKYIQDFIYKGPVYMIRKKKGGRFSNVSVLVYFLYKTTI